MSDIVLETIKATVIGLIFGYLWWTGKKAQLNRQPGWSYIMGEAGKTHLF